MVAWDVANHKMQLMKDKSQVFRNQEYPAQQIVLTRIRSIS